MAKAGVDPMLNSRRTIWPMRAAILLMGFFVILISSGCGPSFPEHRAAASPTPPTNPPEAVKIDKPVNVSFSTYSKDWPVGWQWIDPDERNNPSPHSVKSGVLSIKVPTGKDLYGSNRTAPRYIKPIAGDFQIETRVRFLPKENYQGAGLLIFIDDNNYLRFERAYGGVGGGGEGLRIDVRTGSEYRPIVTPDAIPLELNEVDLKIVRSGTTFLFYWRENEDSSWREAGEYNSDFPDAVLAGLSASNTARAVTAEFAYIRLLPVTER